MQGGPGIYPEYETTSPTFVRKVKNDQAKRSKSFQGHGYHSDGANRGREGKYEYLSDSLQMPVGAEGTAKPEYTYTNGKVGVSNLTPPPPPRLTSNDLDL